MPSCQAARRNFSRTFRSFSRSSSSRIFSALSDSPLPTSLSHLRVISVLMTSEGARYSDICVRFARYGYPGNVSVHP